MVTCGVGLVTIAYGTMVWQVQHVRGKAHQQRSEGAPGAVCKQRLRYKRRRQQRGTCSIIVEGETGISI
jgi:hypothetical protein